MPKHIRNRFLVLFLMVVGTYSSIFVASPIVFVWQTWQKRNGSRK